MQTVGTMYARSGLTDPVVEFLMDSWRSGTKRQYECQLSKWIVYCASNDVNCFEPTLNQVLEFLLENFQKGLGYSSLNTIRSALSAFIQCNGRPIGQDPLVTRFMRSVYNRRPNIPRSNVTWDVNVVLEYLAQIGPAKKIPIWQLTKKVLALMAILSGVRGQSLFLLDVHNMTIDPDFVTFRIAPGQSCTRITLSRLSYYA